MSKENCILVTGASGLLGRPVYCQLCSLAKELADSRPINVVGLCNSRKRDNLIPVDLLDVSRTEALLNDLQPIVIIHCAAECRPDVVNNEPQRAKAVNVEVTERLADWTLRNPQSRMVFISSDYVFDGQHPPYDESSEPNPLNDYGKMKLAGEKIVMKNPNNLILRISILYGEVDNLDESPVTTLFRKLLDSSTTTPISHYERRYPLYVGDVAVIIRKIVRKVLQDINSAVCGVLHVSGPEMLTKYDMVLQMARALEMKEPSHILKDTNAPSPHLPVSRPYDAQLSYLRLREELGICELSRFSTTIGPCLAPFMSA